MIKKIVAASSNAHKIKEIQAIMSKFGMEVISRDEAGVPPFEIEEDGETFEENSYKKANEIMKATGEITVADDSGLMVDYLGGAPGVYSARFAGDHGDDGKNNEKLLKLLEGLPEEERKAKFVSVITLIFPGGEALVARGECAGRIIEAPTGENGFGYDPLFVPDGYDKTFAQLGPEEKNMISHRAKALEKLEKNHIDLILLDVMMPRLNGLSALMKIRESYKIPAIILSAKTEESDKVSGLVLGADDYISKPYNAAELIARVKAQLRRYNTWGAGSPKEDEDTIVNGGLVLDRKQRVAVVEGKEVKLTATEYNILEFLMEHAGQVFPAEQIYENVWNELATFAVENTVMVHIRHIREKIEIDAKNPKYIKVVWGIGYKMEKYGR